MWCQKAAQIIVWHRPKLPKFWSGEKISTYHSSHIIAHDQTNITVTTIAIAIYVNVDSPNIGFPSFNFLGGISEKNHDSHAKR